MSETNGGLSHWAWGYTHRFPDLDTRRGLAAQVAAMLGVNEPSVGPLPTIDDAVVPAVKVPVPDALQGFCSAAREDRVRHTYGRAFRDIVRAFKGDFAAAPDMVAYPKSEDDIALTLDTAASEGLAVVPFGGGTSVVGGLEAPASPRYKGVVSLDLRHFNRLLDVDPVSRAARIQAGATGPMIEGALAAHGLTLRHYPQSFEHSTLGGWIATRAGGHFATLYTHIDDLVESVRMITPNGVWESRRLPGSGAGPSPDRLVLGSEGILGVITEAWLRVQQKPRYRASASLRFARFLDGAEAARAIAQAGLYPANCRLLDPTEALLAQVPSEGGSVLLLAFESADHALQPWLERALTLAQERGGTLLGEPVFRDDGEKGRAGASGTYREAFFQMPYLQSALISLGVIADTFETACTWDRYPAFAKGIRAKVTETMNEVCGAGLLACRFTHVYPDGPAPYFTFIAPARAGEEIAQWSRIKQAACEAIYEGGGTITHHHAVGRMHRPTYEKERPALFGPVLKAAKTALDPSWLLNPGVLVDEPERSAQ